AAEARRIAEEEKAKGEAAAAAAERRAREDEDKAAALLKSARLLIGVNDVAAQRRLKEIVDQYPDSKAAFQAKRLLKKLGPHASCNLFVSCDRNCRVPRRRCRQRTGGEGVGSRCRNGQDRRSENRSSLRGRRPGAARTSRPPLAIGESSVDAED